MNFKNLLIAILVLVSVQSYAQLTISGELRPRAEYRNGYKTLTADGSDAALFVSQRTRLNTKYVTDDYTFFLSFQDVRVWGDVKQLADNGNSLSVHEAWGQVKFNPNFSVKLGRQEIIYDDSRMFGNVGWAQQGRSHDAAIFKFGNENYKLDLGIAYNQDAEALFGNLYTVAGNYKAMQYAWFHKDWSNVKASFLFLNNGLQNVAAEEIRYSQTLGTNLNFKASSNLNVAVNAYLQSGKDVADRDLSAYLVGLDLGYKASDKVNLGLGLEIQSGNAYDGDASENKAFTPFYGTNHKFNGFMDYFYVGNHANSVGLVDIYAKIGTKLGEKSSLTAFIHNFSAQSEIANGVDKSLGTELDLVYSHKLNNDVSIGAGYSQMFAKEGLEAIKGNNDGNGNNWAWLMLTIKPTLFSSK
ncbi:alginate export family protein [uncultured Lutibacter sp.]|uniref:alginate export family protein n=1 Tax=uncultured Lutibacter sp. TaxID=437739 RepID=UPI002604C516|nr:alginate export family protein [uncultured Lutibacter sp.]